LSSGCPTIRDSFLHCFRRQSWVTCLVLLHSSRSFLCLFRASSSVLNGRLRRRSLRLLRLRPTQQHWVDRDSCLLGSRDGLLFRHARSEGCLVNRVASLLRSVFNRRFASGSARFVDGCFAIAFFVDGPRHGLCCFRSFIVWLASVLGRLVSSVTCFLGFWGSCTGG
jgi:hypothetical protein